MHARVPSISTATCFTALKHFIWAFLVSYVPTYCSRMIWLEVDHSSEGNTLLYYVVNETVVFVVDAEGAIA